MPIYRADFDVSGTVVLPNDSQPVVLHGDDPVSEIIIRNAAVDASGFVPRLDMQVIATAETIETVAHAFRELLAQQLDILTFVT